MRLTDRHIQPARALWVEGNSAFNPGHKADAMRWPDLCQTRGARPKTFDASSVSLFQMLRFDDSRRGIAALSREQRRRCCKQFLHFRRLRRLHVVAVWLVQFDSIGIAAAVFVAEGVVVGVAKLAESSPQTQIADIDLESDIALLSLRIHARDAKLLTLAAALARRHTTRLQQTQALIGRTTCGLQASCQVTIQSAGIHRSGRSCSGLPLLSQAAAHRGTAWN